MHLPRSLDSVRRAPFAAVVGFALASYSASFAAEPVARAAAPAAPLAQAEPAKTPPPAAVSPGATTNVSGAALKLLRTIHFPQITLSGARLESVLATLSDLSRTYNPSGEGVKIALLPGASAELRGQVVNLSVRESTLAEVVGALCRQYGFTYDVAQGTVYLIPVGTPTPAEFMETRAFQLPRGTRIRLAGY